MIDLEKILAHLDKQIKKNADALYWAETPHHIVSLEGRLEFLQKLRAALTIEEENENN